MANVYCDQALATGLDNGTSWANAYKLLSNALDGVNTVDGDFLYVKNNASFAVSTTITGPTADGGSNNPPRVIGVKSATSNTPPVASDLIPGWLTGETRTEANLAYNDPEAPTLTVTGSANDINILGNLWLYGVVLIAADNLVSNASFVGHVYNECYLKCGNESAGSYLAVKDISYVLLNNCKLEAVTGQNAWLNCAAGTFLMKGGSVVSGGTPTYFVIIQKGSNIDFIGVDLSGEVSTNMTQASTAWSPITYLRFTNCQMPSGFSFLTGVQTRRQTKIISYASLNLTGKTSGSIQDIEAHPYQGDVVIETTAVRTGGATDGAGLFAYAMTPVVNGTRDYYHALESPEIGLWVVGDGTSKTVTVFIANSGAADYNDDDVWLEVVYPSEGGTARYETLETRMVLLGTPAVVTNDPSSIWGTGGNNPQKLTASIAPDYEGPIRCRVMFAKNFGAAPETLYVDPLPTVA